MLPIAVPQPDAVRCQMSPVSVRSSMSPGFVSVLDVEAVFTYHFEPPTGEPPTWVHAPDTLR
jgi:hypothetical protein